MVFICNVVFEIGVGIGLGDDSVLIET